MRTMWRGVIAVALVVAGALPGLGARAARAEADWEPTGLTGPVDRRMTPASGALFAVIREDAWYDTDCRRDIATCADTELLRSDDAGATRAAVALPPARADKQGRVIAVDPTDHRVIYAGGDGGLHKTDDDAASWRLIFGAAEPVQAVVVSPAGPRTVYLVLAPHYPQVGSFRLLRSRDGGGGWESMRDVPRRGCYWDISGFAAHPADPDRLYGIVECVTSSLEDRVLRQSFDGGRSWGDVSPPEHDDPEMTYLPNWGQVVGGGGALPARLYMGAYRKELVGGCYFFRSDDDGQTWTKILSFRGFPSVGGGGLAYEPTTPDRLFVALNESTRDESGAFKRTARVVVTTDAGASWAEVGRRDLPESPGLALGIDGRNLYLATADGVLRRSLP